MKSSISTYAAVFALTALVAAPGSLFAADTVPPDKAAPGTAQETDTKSQENNPAGPATQSPGTPVADPDSKTGDTKDANHATSVKTPAPNEATKKPQHKKHKKHVATTTTTPSN